MIHIGNNIAKLRGFRRFTQKDIAAKLQLTQQEYSRIEQKEQIDDDMLNLIADVIDFPVDLIKTLDDNNSVQNVYQQDGNKGHVFNYDFNPTDKIIELYERLLKEKDEIIATYKRQQKVS